MDLNITPGAREADPYLSRTSIAQAAAGRTTIAPKAPGQIHKLAGFLLSLDADGTIGFESVAGNAKASLTTALAGADNDMKIEALVAGVEGNAYTFAIVAPVDDDQAHALSVSCSAAGVVVVTPAVNADGSTINSTATAVVAALNADATFATLMVATVKAGDSGAGIVVAVAAANLTGGTDTVTDLTGDLPLLAKAPFGYKSDVEFPVVKTAAGEKLCVFSATGKAFGVCSYSTEGS